MTSTFPMTNLFAEEAQEWRVSWTDTETGQKKELPAFNFLTAMHIANHLQNARLIVWKRHSR